MESLGTFVLIDMVYYYFPFTRRRRGLEEGLGGLDVESLVGMRKWDLKQRRDMSCFLQAHSTIPFMNNLGKVSWKACGCKNILMNGERQTISRLL